MKATRNLMVALALAIPATALAQAAPQPATPHAPVEAKRQAEITR